MKEYSEWRVRGMLSYLSNLGAFVEQNDSFAVSDVFKKTFHQRLRDIYEQGQLKVENLDEKINEALILTLREFNFFKEAKSTKEVVFAVQILRSFQDDAWVESLTKALGV